MTDNQDKVRVLSGIQPSGNLHLGNYFAMMKPMIESQESSLLFCFIVNYHALTSVREGRLLKQQTLGAAKDFLALGLDPDRCVFWVQSDVPEVTELTWILSCVTSMGLLERCHSYKDKVSKGLIPTHGLFAYPVLMAADILLYQSQVIPVGKDQKQHVEVTRDIAERFNHHYGETFVLPEPRIEEDVAVVPGIDGQKMSKSYGNTIEIFSDEKAMRKRIMRIVTDATPVEAPKDPENVQCVSSCTGCLQPPMKSPNWTSATARAARGTPLPRKCFLKRCGIISNRIANGAWHLKKSVRPSKKSWPKAPTKRVITRPKTLRKVRRKNRTGVSQIVTMNIINYLKWFSEDWLAAGSAVRKRYQAFKSLLGHDKSAHEQMAALEEIY